MKIKEELIEHEDDLKDAFGVIGIIFFGIIVYWYITGGPFKSLQG